jgi:hypothetical protein
MLARKQGRIWNNAHKPGAPVRETQGQYCPHTVAKEKKAMQTNEIQPSRVRRTVNDLVLAEMFLVQATIESAAAIGDGINELGRQLSTDNDKQVSPWDSISSVLRSTADEAVEPYTSRFRYLRDMINNED